MSLCEKERVESLRSLVEGDLTPYYDTHFNIARWLQGHPGVPLQTVSSKLRHHLQFRRSSWSVDEIHKRKRGYHPIHSHWVHGITGASGVIDNVIVNIEQCGLVDYDGMLANYSISEVMKARVFDLEEMLSEVMKKEKETGEQASILYVMDAGGLEYTKKLVDLVLGSLRSLSEFMADHYVELIKYFVVVNVPSWCYALWMMVKPEILQYASPSACPSFWNEDGVSLFTALVDRPVMFPKVDLAEEVGEGGMDKLWVKAGYEHWLSFDLNKGDEIAWSFVGSQSYGFALLKSKDGKEENAMEMPQLYPMFPWMPGPTQVPLEDSLVVPESGCYKIWLSNTRAWFHSLAVDYKVTVTTTKS